MARFLVAFFILLSFPHAGRGDPPAHKSSALPEVTIEAERAKLERRVNTFISRITARVSDNSSLARWNIPICPLVSGLPVDAGESVLQRLSEIAMAAGASLGSPRCRPNLYILLTSEPTELLKQWRKKDPYIFGVLDADDPRHAPPAMVARFLRTDRPVRVWYNFNNPDAVLPNDRLVDLQGGFEGAHAGCSGGNAQLVWYIIQNLSSVVVVVDSRRTRGITVGQLSDYIAMVAFTQVDLDADISNSPTVLRLFADSHAGNPTPDGLSAWDRGFLKGLYHTDQCARLQRFAISRVVVQEIPQSGP